MDTQQTHAPQPMVPALRALYEPLAPYAYALMRFCVGATIVPHGYTKLFQGTVAPAAGMIAKLGLEPAVAWAYFVGGVEFFGGILFAGRPLAPPAGAVPGGRVGGHLVGRQICHRLL